MNLHELEREARRAGRLFRWSHGVAADWAHTWAAIRKHIPTDMHMGLEQRLYATWAEAAGVALPQPRTVTP